MPLIGGGTVGGECHRQAQASRDRAACGSDAGLGLSVVIPIGPIHRTEPLGWGDVCLGPPSIYGDIATRRCSVLRSEQFV